MSDTYAMAGPCHISVISKDEAGQVTRRSILPGTFINGEWVSTDLSGEPSDVTALADEYWTSEAVAEYQAIHAPVPNTAADVKAECRRRILLIMNEDQQRNTLAAGQAAVMQYGPDPANWPEPLQQRQQAAMVAWTEIERLRARSNEIELMEPIPDVSRDDLWLAP